MKVYVFPGQGSQKKGMGSDLFDKYPTLVATADKVLGYSIKALCLEDLHRKLNKTQYTQPALYVVNALSYLNKIEEEGKRPDFVAGHSLGEFNALLAAECFDFETGLRIVKKRGELMSLAQEGSMAAILNASSEKVQNILREKNLNSIDIANYNSATQIVISGSVEDIKRAESFFHNGETLYYLLNTGGAFHSRFMEPSRHEFEAYLRQFSFAKPSVPVIANVDALPYQDNHVVENLSRQISSSVRWSESIVYLLKLAATRGVVADIEEVGHGDVLTKIVAKIKTESVGLVTEVLFKPKVDNENNPVKIQESLVNRLSANTNLHTNRKQFIGDIVKNWNQTHRIGTKIRSTTMDYENLETETDGVVLFDGLRAAVYVKGFNGYFDLEEVEVMF